MSVELDPVDRPPVAQESAVRGAEEADDLVSYRALNTLAVASLVLGLLSVLAFVSESLGVIPLAGLLLGLRARYKIRRNPDELTGLWLAHAGMGLSALLLTSSWAWMGYVYATEVPPGFRRITYDVLNPTAQTPDDLIPPSAEALEGQKVFIKGFMRPETALPSRDRVKSFVMVRDNNQCCFGAAQPKLPDMILVELTGDLRLPYRMRMVKVAGTFHVAPQIGAGGVGTVAYRLDAEHAE